MHQVESAKTQRKIQELSELLDREFEALKNQDFPLFEQLQDRKNQILAFISESRLLEELQSLSKQTESDDEHSRSLETLHQSISTCSTLQSRNEVLIRHKLIAIRETIDSFTMPNSSIAETYDSLGSMKKTSVKRPRNF